MYEQPCHLQQPFCRPFYTAQPHKERQVFIPRTCTLLTRCPDMQAQETQAQTQIQTQTPENQAQAQVQAQTIQIHPVAVEIAEAADWVVPGLQAYYNSPNWQPVLLKDAVVYIWPDGDECEALLVPSRPMFKLFYITRTSENVLLFLVEPQMIGGRTSNLYREPIVFDNYYLSEFIALFVAFRGDLKRIVTECSSNGSGVCVVCGKRDVCYDDSRLTVTITPVTQQDDP